MSAFGCALLQTEVQGGVSNGDSVPNIMGVKLYEQACQAHGLLSELCEFMAPLQRTMQR